MNYLNTGNLSYRIDRNNRFILAIVVGGFGLFGSLISILVSLSAICALAYICVGKISLHSSIDIRRITLILCLFFLAGVFQALVHFQPKNSLDVIIMRLPFLEFLPLVSVFAFTKPEKVRQSMETGASIGSIATCAYVIFELVFLHQRAWGGAGNPGPFATVTAVMFLICVCAVVRQENSTNRNLHYVGMIAAAICIMASGMRSILPILIFVPILAWWFIYPIKGAKIKNFTFLCFAGLLIFALLPFDGFPRDRINTLIDDYILITTSLSYNNSLGQRLILWEYALQSIPKSPILGFGYEEARSGAAAFAESNYGLSFSKAHFHNLFLTAMMRGGFIELAVTLALLIAPVLLAYKRRHAPLGRYGFTIIAGVMVIFLCSGIMNLSFHHDIMDHLFIFMISLGSYIAFTSKTTDGPAL